MPDYKKMYIELFHAVTATIEELKRAQRNAEQTYIASEEAPIKIIDDEYKK